MSRNPVKDSPYQVQVLDRAVTILDALADHRGDLSLFELAERLDLHKSTIHRLLMVLERHRLVERMQESGKYGLGMKLFELGSKASHRVGLGDRARPYLEQLATGTGETAHLCALDRGEVVYLAKVEPRRSVRVPTDIGQRNPVHCTSVGKALIAYLPEVDLDALLRAHPLKAFTPNTITSPALLKRELKGIRERGYAIDDEEIEEGLRCIGAPVRDHTGKVVASMSVASPAFRLSRAKVPTVARVVVKCADGLSQELGHGPSPSVNGRVTAPRRSTAEG